MRISTLFHLAPRVRLGAILATLSLIIGSGLTACSGTSPTEPILEVSVDPGRIGDQTAIPTEWLAPTTGGARVSTQSSAKRVQQKPDALRYVR